jgi:hypothetical protein
LSVFNGLRFRIFRAAGRDVGAAITMAAFLPQHMGGMACERGGMQWLGGGKQVVVGSKY